MVRMLRMVRMVRMVTTAIRPKIFRHRMRTLLTGSNRADRAQLSGLSQARRSLLSVPYGSALVSTLARITKNSDKPCLAASSPVM